MALKPIRVICVLFGVLAGIAALVGVVRMTGIATPGETPRSLGSGGALYGPEKSDIGSAWVAAQDHGLTYHALWPAAMYDPPGGQARGTVLVIHAGAGGWGDKGDAVNVRLCADLARDGFRAVAVNYRLTQHALWPAAVLDVKAMIDRFSIGGPVYVIGLSYGGTLGELATAHEPSRVRGFVSVAAPHDLTTWTRTMVGGTDRYHASPLYQAGVGFPPTLLLHGDNDSVVPPIQTQRMAQTLRGLGTPVRYEPLVGMGHFAPAGVALSDDTMEDFYRVMYPRIASWLRQQAMRAPV